MRAPGMLKISLGLAVFAGMLLLSPSARAQSEVAPDHFDGTDSWAVALARESRAASKKAKPLTTVKQAEATGIRDKANVPQSQPVALVTPQRKRTAALKDQKKQ